MPLLHMIHITMMNSMLMSMAVGVISQEEVVPVVPETVETKTGPLEGSEITVVLPEVE